MKIKKGLINKLLVASAPIQTLGILSNAPLLLFLARVFEIRKVNIFQLLIVFSLIVFTLAISQNFLSSLKIISFLLITYLGFILSPLEYRSSNIGIFIVISILFIERQLVYLGINSPFSYDEFNPTLILFAEKSYAALFISFLYVLDILQGKKIRTLFVWYLLAFYLLKSDLGYLIFTAFFIFSILPPRLIYLLGYTSIPIAASLYLVPIYFFSSEQLQIIYSISGTENLLRYFVNLVSFDLGIENSFSGTNLTNDLDLYEKSSYAKEFLGAEHIVEGWKNMSGQAIIPNLTLYFGPLGLIASLIFNYFFD